MQNTIYTNPNTASPVQNLANHLQTSSLLTLTGKRSGDILQSPNKKSNTNRSCLSCGKFDHKTKANKKCSYNHSNNLFGTNTLAIHSINNFSQNMPV